MAGKGGLAARIGWVVAASGPPLAVAGVWRDLVLDHPVFAMVLLIVYEMLVAAVAFAGEIVGELRKRWRERIVDRVDRALGRWVSRFDRRYREYVLGSLRFIDLKGLVTVGYFTPELDEVFVNVSLAFRAPNQVSEGLLAELPVEVTDRHSIGDFLDHPHQWSWWSSVFLAAGRPRSCGTPPGMPAGPDGIGGARSRYCFICVIMSLRLSRRRMSHFLSCCAECSGGTVQMNQLTGSNNGYATATAWCSSTAWTKWPVKRTAGAWLTGSNIRSGSIRRMTM